MWDMKVTIIAIVIGALGIVTKGLVQGLKDLEITGRVETIQITALLRSARIPRGVLETCCHSISSEKPPANAGVKNSKTNNNYRKINNNNNDYYYYYYLRVFQTSARWLCSSGEWVTASLLKSPELFSVFKPILIMIFEYSLLVL